MPSYLYRCSDCKEKFEISLSLKEKEDGKANCPTCSSLNLNQILSTGGILKHGLSKSCDPSPKCGGCSAGNCPVR